MLKPYEHSMRNYSSAKLELLVLKWAVCEKFKDYLISSKFTVLTDNNPLTYVCTSRLGAAKIHWFSDLALFDFEIKYRSNTCGHCGRDSIVCLTSFDLAQGYLQLAMDEADIHKTSFHAGSSGLYEFTHMPFGLSNAGASFCRLMEMCLGDQQYLTLLFYLDDICVFSSSVDKMLDRITMVFGHLKEFNLKIKPKKSFFFQSSVLFLGHLLSKDGILPNPEKVNKVKDWPILKNAKEVHSFLGLASYYRRFIPQFSKWASPLHDLIRPIATTKKHARVNSLLWLTIYHPSNGLQSIWNHLIS